MKTGMGLKELKSCLVDIALTHPTISISKVKVPAQLIAMQQIMQNFVHHNRIQEHNAKTGLKKNYMAWTEFVDFCISRSI